MGGLGTSMGVMGAMMLFVATLAGFSRVCAAQNFRGTICVVDGNECLPPDEGGSVCETNCHEQCCTGGINNAVFVAEMVCLSTTSYTLVMNPTGDCGFTSGAVVNGTFDAEDTCYPYFSNEFVNASFYASCVEIPTATPTPTPSPTATPVCIDAGWIEANHAGFEVHTEAVMADVLCYGALLPCATGGHVVAREGSLMTMAELCGEEKGACRGATMMVNGVQHRRSDLMPCDGNVCMTTLDARSNTLWKRAENTLVYFLLQNGNANVAERLTRVQLAAAARS